jgi:Ca-activated chloride channel family protein
VRFRPFVDTDQDPLSTFALDVDTGSYTLARRTIDAGSRPQPGSVRVEEFVNSFRYDYQAPGDGLGLQADAGPSPFDPDNVILRVGVQAERVTNAERPAASLTFVVDTSGSMDRTDRLGLVKSSLTRLAAELEADDTVAIVTYSNEATIILPPTSAADQGTIRDAIDRLSPNGSTNLEAGLRAGYDLAGQTLEPGRINRVILASDGIANVGLTDPAGLSRLIRDDADRGIQLVTVGVGMDGFNDELMEQLADRGDGFYAYVDDQAQAEVLFGDQLVSTLLTVALDGKIQVEFDPDTVQRYRLIGFENRAVLDDDFRNDAVDAGELGAGHQVTALYELTLASGFGSGDRLGVIRIRWEDPDDGSVDETSLAIGSDLVEDRWADTDPDFRLAVTVAAWAELLRGSPYTGDVTVDQVQAEASALSPGSGPVEELARLIAATG